jgi:UDP-N-acetylmuramate--alanine ligase
MEVLARLLAALGCRVSGTDARPSAVLAGLRRDGFDVQRGHHAAAVGDADLVVYSTAVPVSNPELCQARARGITTVTRAELLGALSSQFLTIGVAGSHGKTTTSSMLAAILTTAGWDISTAIGGWRNGNAQARLGSDRHFVVEADEYQRAFYHLAPSWAIVTSVDAEHLDCYADLAAVEAAFARFLSRLPFYGHAIIAGDGSIGRGATDCIAGRYSTYGLGADNVYRAVDLEPQAWGTRFRLVRQSGSECSVDIELHTPGRHNVMNATAAAAMALHLGLPGAAAATALGAFGGVARRFERLGEAAGVLVVDDYAHHPVEVAAAVAAARDSGRRVVAVFQPHLYSRTQKLFADFAAALGAADEVFLAPVYGAREEPLDGVSSELIAGAMADAGYAAVTLVDDMDTLSASVLQSCRPGDLVMTLGAGDIDQSAAQLLLQLAEGG